jgi:hypothetical protein
MDPGPGDSPQDDIGRLFAARQEFDAQAQRFEPARGRADLTGAMAELAQVPGLARFRAAESPEIGAAIGTADRMRRARLGRLDTWLLPYSAGTRRRMRRPMVMTRWADDS